MKRFLIANIGSNTEISYLAPYLNWNHRRILTVPQVDQDASFWTTVFGAGWEGIPVEPVQEVTNVYHGLTLFSKLATYDELDAVPNSFYWDFASQTLFIRVYQDTPEYLIPTVYAYGLAVGVIDSSDIDDEGLINSTIGGIAYHPALITGGMSAMVSVDNYRFNKMTMDDFTITINNGSGIWDNARSAFYKQRCDILLADVPDDRPAIADDFNMIRSGIVDEISYSSDTTFTLRVIDPRRTWDRIIPFEVFTAADFEDPTENRAETIIGKTKPLAVGPMTRVPAVPLSATTTLNTSQHLISTTSYGPLTEVTGCWEIVDDIETERTYDVDLNTGILTITTGQYQGGQIIVDGIGVSVDRSIYVDSSPVTGYENTPQQIAYALATRLGGIPNTAGYFDRQSFRDAEVPDSQASVYIKTGGEKLTEVIDNITIPANWMMYVEAGVFRAVRFTGDSSNPDRLYPDELAAPPNIMWDTDSFSTRIQYNYRPEIWYDTSLSLFDDSREAALIPRYRVSVLADVTSPFFTTEAADYHMAERYERISFIPANIECDLLETPRWNLFDFVIFNYLMDGRQRLPEMTYRVIGLDKVGKKAILRQYTDIPVNEESIYSIYRRINGKSA